MNTVLNEAVSNESVADVMLLLQTTSFTTTNTQQ